MSTKRYINEPRAISFEYYTFFKIYNKEFSDIEDIILNLKKDPATDTDDAYLQKKQSENGVYLDQNNGKIYMHLNTQLVGSKIVPTNGTDYQNITVGNYYLCGGVKFTGVDKIVEFVFEGDDNMIKIITDTNRA